MAHRKFLWVVPVLLLAMALASGCTAGGQPVSLEGPGAGSGEQATPADMGRPAGGDEAVEDSTADDETVVSSTGETVSGSKASGERVVGKVPGQDAGGSDTVVEEGKDVTWQVYRNEEFGFEIRYPSVYVLVPAPEPVELESPQPLAQVLFQDADLARGDTAAMEPPQFAIRIFANEVGLGAEAWFRDSGLVQGGVGWEAAPYTLAGVEGVQVTSQLLMAPGRSIYLPKGKYVFELTPLGEYSNRMLASFAFTR